ncbi:triose-phosphate isomerase [Actinomadura montaniterrae]|jgi:triosephosphate isomerase|uniref:Triosephosphate isomerase n=1 Tax=Actinomadura montaniterrae TaxID=1803903 RepID=A0A6L3VQZ0_9ACTN|nr:triose-phosphate isomerase [Actinomadura montaniterrae]KAB2376047.1 triose-phosphate isomerase [Actinomadura montaniterrae]
MAAATPARKPLMAGNWKMNKNHLDALLLVQKMAFALKEPDFEAVDVVVCPPFTDLRTVQTVIAADNYAIQYGAQDVSQHASGAYTGEIAASMLAKLGCSYVIVGHSERREYHAEDDALVNAKAKAVLGAEMTPIVCVGEGLEVRKSGGHVAHVLAQLDGALEKISAEQVRRTVIAYEPVWAIGTGEVATPQDAQEVCGAIRTRLAELYDGGVADQVRILYGGSVKGDNIARLMAQADVDGALVGGASLDPGEFVKICRYRDLPA